jgi:carbamoyl-phosphate synthase/aspartate carbamoyltransferase/dihydroorotase/carbamoyl-phosphate synthase/aspartate carbamoyltransferase
MNNNHVNLVGRDILSVSQFGLEELSYLFTLAGQMRQLVSQAGCIDLLRGYVMAAIFYEPSTRTSASFLTAMQRLGGGIIPITEVKSSSVAKGESLADSIRTLDQYADVIVIRNPEIGSAQVAADNAESPVINAGDGAGEHPTQALLDGFTIVDELGHMDGLSIAMVGDLKYGRTVHSLAKLLSLYDVRLTFVSPESLRMPEAITFELREKNVPVYETDNVGGVIADSDVLYVTRVQKERFDDQARYEAVKGSYVITPELLSRAKEKMVVMHPLPRVNEIDYAVDHDKRAVYFRQAKNGMYLRMALLAAVLGRI